MNTDLVIVPFKRKILGSLLCLVRLHPWTHWSSPAETNVYDSEDRTPLDRKLPIYRKLTQARACRHCRRVQTRTWKV
jgi:hypothetical protein